MTDITLSNQKSVQEFTTYILERIQASNKNWWEIAKAFSEAREMYGFESDNFKKLCIETKFSKSKASKLATIAMSERLKTYAVKLSAVHSWGTLYAIATLNDQQFQDLKQKLRLDDPKAEVPFVTQAEVERFKRGKTERSVFKNYAVIKIDEEALKGELITGEDCQALNALIAQIEAISSHIKVRHMNLDDKESARFMTHLVERKRQLVRQAFVREIGSRLERKPKQKNESQVQFESRMLGMSRGELLAKLNDSEKAAFEYLGLIYDEAKFYDEAQSALNARAERYAQKVLDRLPKGENIKEPLTKAA